MTSPQGQATKDEFLVYRLKAHHKSPCHNTPLWTSYEKACWGLMCSQCGKAYLTETGRRAYNPPRPTLAPSDIEEIGPLCPRCRPGSLQLELNLPNT